MVTHVVIFTWLDDVSAKKTAEFSRALDRLASEFRETAKIVHGPDLHFRDGNGDYALVASFRNRADWDAYQSDPRHQAFLRDFVNPILDSRQSIQF